MPSCLTCQSTAGGEERPASRRPAGLSFGSDHSRVLRPVVTSAPTLCWAPALTGHPGVAWGTEAGPCQEKRCLRISCAKSARPSLVFVLGFFFLCLMIIYKLREQALCAGDVPVPS